MPAAEYPTSTCKLRLYIWRLVKRLQQLSTSSTTPSATLAILPTYKQRTCFTVYFAPQSKFFGAGRTAASLRRRISGRLGRSQQQMARRLGSNQSQVEGQSTRWKPASSISIRAATHATSRTSCTARKLYTTKLQPTSAEQPVSASSSA